MQRPMRAVLIQVVGRLPLTAEARVRS